MLLMVKTGITEGICHAIHRYAKLVTNIWMIIIRIKNHILNIGT